MIYYFSQSYIQGSGIWAELDGLSAHCGIICWSHSFVQWLGWVKGFNRVSNHWSGTLIVFHMASVSLSGILLFLKILFVYF